ncbi:phosphatidylserine/phosphatidylglycerophosphate/cardiolipin synthase family protein [Sphingobium sp. H33]|uniref:Phospholipase D n=2 Tax=Sphingobium nicotianae TaxID=2782607 RepID=A0A9X1AJN7_9SPHN|nr:phosphatidylserine/phosphatidylglycerophosphate/cardiolipin synthase family protein [Sphingobium nicotianae]
MESIETDAGLAPHIVDGNELTLLPGGAERLKALIDLIEGAQARLDLYYYIFAKDVCGEQVAEALIDACNRGVAVTLMVDAFGSATTPQVFFDALVRAGGRFAWFGARRSTRYLIRNHQKMVIADGRRVLIGGFNCEQLYFGRDDDPASWCDLGLLVKGPLAADLERWFRALAHWTIESEQKFRHLRRMVRIWKPSDGTVSWLIGGPIRKPQSSWVRQIVHDLQACRRLDLVAAYFSPNPGMMRRIDAIARRGSARIITAMTSDNKATVGAARHLYKRLLRAGTTVFEFRPQKLHMKLIVVDNVTYVGSANFDMRSLYINLELMLRVDDAGFAAEAREMIDRMEKRSRGIDETSYAMMAGPLRRFVWWCDYLLVGVLDYTVTRRLNFRRRRD